MLNVLKTQKISMYNILVTGSNGQLGSEIRGLVEAYSNYYFLFTDVEELDICNHSLVEQFIVEKNIDVILNCAAYTAVDKAEENIDIANEINHLAVKNFAEIAKENNVKLIHISTDYVFDGKAHKPYTEIDTPNPQSVYGTTKLAGEVAMLNINPANSIIIRTSWVYSSFGNNFVKTMLRLGNERDELNVVADQIGTPTNAADLAKAILTILPQLKNEAVDLFHYSNEGVCSWYDFAKEIFSLCEIENNIKPIKTEDYPTDAYRPKYSVLDTSKFFKSYQLTISYWKDSLRECINTFTENV